MRRGCGKNSTAFFSLGWSHQGRNWRPYKSAYLYLAALTTAFVPCVASIVSWDYALTIVPGYHSTIYGPYFLVGAVHSGLAMLLTLLIPLRSIYAFQEIITIEVLEKIALVLVFTALMMGYDYIVEYFMAWYSGNNTEWMTFVLRAWGKGAPMFWFVVITTIVWPLLFMVKKIRTSTVWLFVTAIVMNIGMWLERFVIIIGPPSHGYDPYSWGSFWPSWVEWGILFGSFSFFFLLFLLYSKLIPTISMAEIKEDLKAPVRGDSRRNQGGDGPPESGGDTPLPPSRGE